MLYADAGGVTIVNGLYKSADELIYVSVAMYSIKKRCNYQNEVLGDAIADVKRGARTVSDAARHYKIPRSTLDHKVNGRHGGEYGGRTKLSAEDEIALVQYVKYMDKIGHPLGVQEIKMFAWSIAKRSTNPDCFGDNGPSKKWWLGFRKRHKSLTLRKPDKLDRRRSRTAKKSVVKEHFDKLKEALEKADLLDKPEHIFNVDETGIEMNKQSGKVVVDRCTKKHHQESVGDREHITANICCSSTGYVLPPMLIFQKCFPSTDYSSAGPDDCLYAKSESGYMDGELFLAWFKNIFLPKTAHLRPAMLIMDGHTSHLTIELIDLACKNNVILYCLPPHLTYLLQPLDVAVFKSLKDYFTRYSHQAKLISLVASCILVVNRSNFTAIFKEAFEKSMVMATIKNGFRKCGISPFDPTAVDWSKLTDDEAIESTSNDSVPGPSTSNGSAPASMPSSTVPSTSSSSSSFAAVANHPIVQSQCFPERLRDVLLIPHFEGQKKKSVRITTSARVLTSKEHRDLFKKKMHDAAQKELEKAQRKAVREQKKAEKEQKKTTAAATTSKNSARIKTYIASAAPTRASSRLAQLPAQDYKKLVSFQVSDSESEESDEVSARCGKWDPPGEDREVDWLECESCQRWYHKDCEFPEHHSGQASVICTRC